jgi:hypothetical protein
MNISLPLLSGTQTRRYIKKLKKAWKIDLKKGLFTPVDPKRMTCINEGYGL